MGKAKTQTKTQSKIEVPNAAPPSRMERNQPKSPTTIRVCGNPVKVVNGKAGEADPRILRARRKEALEKRGKKDGKTYREDETRI